MPKKNTKNITKTISDRKTQQLNFLEDNKKSNITASFINIVNTPKYLMISLIIPIIYYFLIKSFTDNILQDTNCTCVLEKNITDIKQRSLYLIGFQIIITVLKFYNAPQLIISILSIITLILLISVFINWLAISKNIDENKCKCANTSLRTIISLIAWTQIILLSISPLLAIIFLIMYLTSIFFVKNI